MPKFRKKPVEIEAVQIDGDGNVALKPEWLSNAIANGTVYYQGGERPYWTIQTLEGDHRADPMDWIIRGIKGELYPCKPDIFAATYDAA